MVALQVLSIQCSVFSMAIAVVESPRFLVGRLKHVSFLLVLLNTEPWTLKTAHARELGTHGVIYAIEEQDPIALIQQKLEVMENSGALERRNLELQKKAQASVERPKPVEGIERAPVSRVLYYDPTYIVQADHKDHQGQIFAKKGTRINPLETVSLSTNLLFFDGDDEEQLAWAKEQLTKPIGTNSIRLILVKGAPLKLAEELNIPVYFDQGGILSKKLRISHVPVLVSQEKLRLRIEEIKLPPSGESIVEGGA